MSKKQKPLSPEMQRCLDIVTEHGSIVRYEGGFWAKPNDELEGRLKNNGNVDRKYKNVIDGYFCHPKVYIGSGTIKALLSRKLLQVSENAKGMYGEYPCVCVKFGTDFDLPKSNNNEHAG